MRNPSVRRPTVLLLLGVLGVAALGACGQKGPLYLPADAPATAAPPAAPTDDKDGKEKDETPPAGAPNPR